MTETRTHRFSHTLHNIVGHPAMEVLYLLGFDKAANWVHDNTLPKLSQCAVCGEVISPGEICFSCGN